jgi:hypothetical protein
MKFYSSLGRSRTTQGHASYHFSRLCSPSEDNTQPKIRRISLFFFPVFFSFFLFLGDILGSWQRHRERRRSTQRNYITVTDFTNIGKYLCCSLCSATAAAAGDYDLCEFVSNVTFFHQTEIHTFPPNTHSLNYFYLAFSATIYYYYFYKTPIMNDYYTIYRYFSSLLYFSLCCIPVSRAIFQSEHDRRGRRSH